MSSACALAYLPNIEIVEAHGRDDSGCLPLMNQKPLNYIEYFSC